MCLHTQTLEAVFYCFIKNSIFLYFILESHQIWRYKVLSRENLFCAGSFYSSDSTGCVGYPSEQRYHYQAPLRVSGPFMVFFLHVGFFYLCSHSAQWVPRALLNYAGTEAVRLDVSYCIVKCLSWWKQPGPRGHFADGARHTNWKPTYEHTHTHTRTRWYVNCMPFTLLLSLFILYWRRGENESTVAPGGTLHSRKGSHTCDLQHYNTLVRLSALKSNLQES